MSQLLTIELNGRVETFHSLNHKGKALYSMNEVWERCMLSKAADHPTQWHHEHVRTLITSRDMILLDRDKTSQAAVYEWYASEYIIYMYLAAVSLEFHSRVMSAFCSLVDSK